MCEWGNCKRVKVWIPPDLDCAGRGKWKYAAIDSCIAPIVNALQRTGINMRGSCCGHGKHRGRIDLEDGRILWIQSPQEKREAGEGIRLSGGGD